MVQSLDASLGDPSPEVGETKYPLPAWLCNLTSNPLAATALVGLGSAVLVAVRLISVAGYNVETSYGILQASGTTAIIVGTVMSLIPGIAVIVAGGTILILQYCRVSAWTAFLLRLLACIFGIVAILATPLLYWGALPVGVAILALIGRFRDKIQKVSRHHKVSNSLALLAAGLLVLGVSQSPPWVPEEHFTFNGGAQVTGYLLSQTDNVTTIPQAKPREIGYYDTSGLQNQKACKIVPWYGFSATYYISYILGSTVRYPPCVPVTAKTR